MKALIIDHESGKLVTTTIPESYENNVEDYIIGVLNYKDSTTQWVTTNEDTFKVYHHCGDIEPYAEF